jgi:hypothetical protein
MGHAGAGVVARTLIGDGCYPVFARLDDDGAVEGLAIDFRVADYDGELEHDDIIKILSDPMSKDSNGAPRSSAEIKNMLMEREDPGIWPAVRRLVEGADMMEPLMEDMKAPIKGVEDLQKDVVESAQVAIAAIRVVDNAMRLIGVKLKQEDDQVGLDDLKALNADEVSSE